MAWGWRRALPMADADRAHQTAMRAEAEAITARREANGVWVETQVLGELLAVMLAQLAVEMAHGGDPEAHLNALLTPSREMQEMSEENGGTDVVTARRRRLLAHLSETARNHLATLSR